MPGALFFDGWEGASATIFDCDGTYLANVTLEDVNSETVWFCLPGASDYGRLKVNVSSEKKARFMLSFEQLASQVHAVL